MEGVRLHLLDWGGKGEAVVLLHGLGGNPHTFRGQIGGVVGSGGATRAAAEAELLRLTEETIAALTAGDRAFFEALLADDYLGTTRDGRVVDRAEFFATFSPPPASIQPRFEVVEPRVRLRGATAILNARRNFRAVINGWPVAQSERTTHTFVRADGRWRLLAEHSSPLAPPAG